MIKVPDSELCLHPETNKAVRHTGGSTHFECLACELYIHPYQRVSVNWIQMKSKDWKLMIENELIPVAYIFKSNNDKYCVFTTGLYSEKHWYTDTLERAFNLGIEISGC